MYPNDIPNPSPGHSAHSTTSHSRGQSPQTYLPTPPSTPYAEDSIDDLDENQRRRLELLLLHHFTNYTNPTFPGFAKPEVARNWIKQQIHLGLEHEFVLHILLAVSALHVVVEPPSWIGFGPNHEYDFARCHRVYLNMATKGQREALANLNESNAAALSSASMLFNYAAMGLLPDERTDEYVVPVHSLSMSAAIRTVMQATSPYLEGSRWDVLKYMRESSGPDFRDEKQCFDFEYGEPFRSLLAFNDDTEIVDEDLFQVYHFVAAYLSKCNKVIAEVTDSEAVLCRRLLGLGSMVPRPFITLFGQQKPRALAIMAHYFALRKSVEQFWWFRGTADRDVHGIRSLLPAHWQWAMEWPLATLKTFTGTNYHLHQPVSGEIDSMMRLAVD